jgi:hypothetical protein
VKIGSKAKITGHFDFFVGVTVFVNGDDLLKHADLFGHGLSRNGHCKTVSTHRLPAVFFFWKPSRSTPSFAVQGLDINDALTTSFPAYRIPKTSTSTPYRQKTTKNDKKRPIPFNSSFQIYLSIFIVSKKTRFRNVVQPIHPKTTLRPYTHGAAGL